MAQAKLRVAVDVHAIGQQATGNETYAAGLVQAFAMQPPDDIELLLYHTGTGSGLHCETRLRTLRVAWPWLRIPVVTPWYLMRDRVDVAHFQYFAPPLSPCPTVLTVHDLSYERHPEFFPPAMALRMRVIMPRMVRRARHLIAVSNATRDDLVSLYNVDPARITVIHNGTPPDFRPIDDRIECDRLTARFGFERSFLLCVGNLGMRKNQRLLIRAFARLVHSGFTNVDLVLVGKLSFGGDLVLQEIERSGMQDRVHVTGFVTADELLGLYNRALCSVYPSLFEGFGLPVLESMACGTPVITSTVSSMPEIAGDAALLVDPSQEEELCDAMRRVLESDALRTRLRNAGLLHARSFSWLAAAAKTADVYRHARRA